VFHVERSLQARVIFEVFHAEQSYSRSKVQTSALPGYSTWRTTWESYFRARTRTILKASDSELFSAHLSDLSKTGEAGRLMAGLLERRHRSTAQGRLPKEVWKALIPACRRCVGFALDAKARGRSRGLAFSVRRWRNLLGRVRLGGLSQLSSSEWVEVQ